MPLYEYDCKKCKKQVELLVSRPDAKVSCPECGSKELVKLLSLVSAPVVQGGSDRCALPEMGGGCGKPACGSGGCMFGG